MPIQVSNEAIEFFNDFKKRANGTGTQFILFRLSDDKTQVVFDGEGEYDKYDDFVKQLPADSGRFAVFDLKYEAAGSDEPRAEIVLLNWLPNKVDADTKELYTTAKEAVRRALNGVSAVVSANTPEDASYPVVVREVAHGI